MLTTSYTLYPNSEASVGAVVNGSADVTDPFNRQWTLKGQYPNQVTEVAGASGVHGSYPAVDSLLVQSRACICIHALTSPARPVCYSADTTECSRNSCLHDLGSLLVDVLEQDSRLLDISCRPASSWPTGCDSALLDGPSVYCRSTCATSTGSAPATTGPELRIQRYGAEHNPHRVLPGYHDGLASSQGRYHGCPWARKSVLSLQHQRCRRCRDQYSSSGWCLAAAAGCPALAVSDSCVRC
jgi:hypothetical protein